MQKTKIDWCDSTWNPVTGCLHGCEYCYARGIANRFSGGGEKWTCDKTIVLENRIYGDKIPVLWGPASEKAIPYPYGFKPTLHKYRLEEYKNKKGRNIFVCSMADLFGEWVPDGWIEAVYCACEKAPQHNYLFLTKNPWRYVELQDKGKLITADNMWYGVSVTNENQLRHVAKALGNIKCGTRTFLSIEPIHEDITQSESWNDCIASKYMDWVIIGAESGRRKDKVVPQRTWIRSIVWDCDCEIPVFMKSSLADIWGEPLIQKFPSPLIR